MTGKPSVPIAIELYSPTWLTGSSTVVMVVVRESGSHKALPSAFTPRRKRPTGHPAEPRSCTCDGSICADPTAPPAILPELTAPSASIVLVMPPVATAIVPTVSIGPPLSPAPVPTLVTVPPLLVSASTPQTTVPFALTDRTYSP